MKQQMNSRDAKARAAESRTAQKSALWLALLLAAAFMIALAGQARAQTQQSTPPLPEGLEREVLNQIIEDYIRNHPEVIIESLRSMEERQRQAEADHRRQIILARGEALERDPTSPVFGNPEGDVTIVEFFDYRCGYCRRMMPTIQKLLEEDTNLRWVMKEFPILGPESLYASRAAVAAQKQGKYQEFHLALMSDGVSVTQENVDRIAALLGLDMEQLKADMDSEETKEILANNQRLARELGISGTPSFVLGEEFLPGAVPEEQLRALIERQRETQG